MTLQIDGHGYSSAILNKIVSAAGECKSFQHAARQLHKLAEISISHMQVARLAHEVGRELAEARDHQAWQHRYRQLEADPHPSPVDLACVEADGGRLLTRAPDQSPGVHEKQWKESKVGVLWRMTGETFDEDPHPELPRCFQDRERVPQLMREIHGAPSAAKDAVEQGFPAEEGASLSRAAEAPETSPQERDRWQPERQFRTCVATLRDVHGFGPLVAAEAQRRGFYQGNRRVFLGDGQDSNWTVHRLHFPDFTPVTDFMHAVAYAYAAAQVLSPDQPWQRYLSSARACWQGRVAEVLGELEAWLAQHPLPEGVPLKDVPDQDPRKIVHESLTYFRNNRERMNYPEYRRQGMPVTSSLIESLIKEINWRVKGTDKFWNRPEESPTSSRTGLSVRGRSRDLPEMSAESILQVRAALLCDDNRLQKFIHRRPGSHFVRRKPPAPAVHAV